MRLHVQNIYLKTAISDNNSARKNTFLSMPNIFRITRALSISLFSFSTQFA